MLLAFPVFVHAQEDDEFKCKFYEIQYRIYDNLYEINLQLNFYEQFLNFCPYYWYLKGQKDAFLLCFPLEVSSYETIQPTSNNSSSLYDLREMIISFKSNYEISLSQITNENDRLTLITTIQAYDDILFLIKTLSLDLRNYNYELKK